MKITSAWTTGEYINGHPIISFQVSLGRFGREEYRATENTVVLLPAGVRGLAEMLFLSVKEVPHARLWTPNTGWTP